jgi:antitoxin (DNA-binding transcriptional repressor) of toxin-antitoxin stability system
MEAVKVGIREFRSDLAGYIAAAQPVAVTRHGQTVAYFIPAQGRLQADLAALKQASEVLDQLLAQQALDEDQLVAEFRALRRQAKAKVGPAEQRAGEQAAQPQGTSAPARNE